MTSNRSYNQEDTAGTSGVQRPFNHAQRLQAESEAPEAASTGLAPLYNWLFAMTVKDPDADDQYIVKGTKSEVVIDRECFNKLKVIVGSIAREGGTFAALDNDERTHELAGELIHRLGGGPRVSHDCQ